MNIPPVTVPAALCLSTEKQLADLIRRVPSVTWTARHAVDLIRARSRGVTMVRRTAYFQHALDDHPAQ